MVVNFWNLRVLLHVSGGAVSLLNGELTVIPQSFVGLRLRRTGSFVVFIFIFPLLYVFVHRVRLTDNSKRFLLLSVSWVCGPSTPPRISEFSTCLPRARVFVCLSLCAYEYACMCVSMCMCDKKSEHQQKRIWVVSICFGAEKWRKSPVVNIPIRWGFPGRFVCLFGRFSD